MSQLQYLTTTKVGKSLVCESEYERFSYLMGTDAYGEANKENDFLYLSIKDGKRERVYPLCYR